MVLLEKSFLELEPLRDAIVSAYSEDETVCVKRLLKAGRLPEDAITRIQQNAHHLISSIRRAKRPKMGIEYFLQQYHLSSEEGIALMCLAEALLRVPDKVTVNALISDKISIGKWRNYLGKSDSLFVNAATWGLMLSGKIFSSNADSKKRLSGILTTFSKGTQPLFRRAVLEAMKILSRQFVMAENIDGALRRARPLEAKGYRYSYDMLGEAACTAEDAERYFAAYREAIDKIGRGSTDSNILSRGGISIKLSALHPRYELSQIERVLPEVTASLLELTLAAKQANIGLTVDAEESSRLDLSLSIIEAVFSDKRLANWDGFGIAVQSYQKRAMPLLDWLIALSERHKRRLMVRLIKGAYWDSEIKESQEHGYIDYPVFTRKMSTDVSFLACARKIIAYPGAIYPQFATHNAYTVATILELMDGHHDFEFQCLHGMGELLYRQIVENSDIACRIYAPVGNYESLLPYLVRRLLENGANNSFVNRIVDKDIPITQLTEDPVNYVNRLVTIPNPSIPLPHALYQNYAPGKQRTNASGRNLDDLHTLQRLVASGEQYKRYFYQAVPTLLAKSGEIDSDRKKPIYSPTDRTNQIGTLVEATPSEIRNGFELALLAVSKWNEKPIIERAMYLDQVASQLEENYHQLIFLLIYEAGKTFADAVSEVREAIDFCYYYAEQARTHLEEIQLPGPTGESNCLQQHGRGVMLCISPWNFPLAIFAGQIVAALVAGNAVLAKPAKQTPLIASRFIEILHEAGIPTDIAQFMPSSPKVIAEVLNDDRLAGVLFTGSTQTARIINRALAARNGPIVPFIAETGGQNAMIVDSTALPEQVVRDVISSAFGSAGQRCSALRVLFLQEETADKVIDMLKGAIAELNVGDPIRLATDIGSVIDEKSREELEAHISYLESIGKHISKAPLATQLSEQGFFFAPQAFEIESIAQLKKEIFGPILHVIRYAQRDLNQIIESINNTGYGLTLGIHSRIESFHNKVIKCAQAGNIYVNRNMIGAIVGTQPFGGEGLSGTGPKAGGPHYLLRLCKERTVTINTSAVGGNTSLLSLES